MVEEAEAAPETLTAALQLIALFARGSWRQTVDWPSLSRGPYGKDLLHQAWLLYSPMQWPSDTQLDLTYATLAAYRKSDAYWNTTDGKAELEYLLASENPEEIGRGLMTCLGTQLDKLVSADRLPLSAVERHIYQDDPALLHAAIWAWTLIRREQNLPSPPSPAVLDRILSAWLSTANPEVHRSTGFSLSQQLGMSRRAWKPILTESRVRQVKEAAESRDQQSSYDVPAACFVAFHSGNVWSDGELVERLTELRKGKYISAKANAVLNELRPDPL